jgi:hypothetical protein
MASDLDQLRKLPLDHRYKGIPRDVRAPLVELVAPRNRRVEFVAPQRRLRQASLVRSSATSTTSSTAA